MRYRRHVRLNLQAWRIPLWVFIVSRAVQETLPSQPPSLENPFVGGYWGELGMNWSANVSTSKPGESLCGYTNRKLFNDARVRLNLQAWRIPLWAHDLPRLYNKNAVSTSKPGESLCGALLLWVVRVCLLRSQPPSLENPFVGG